MIKQSENAMIQSATQTPSPEKVLRQVSKVRRSKQVRDRRLSWLVGSAVLAIMMLAAMFIEAQLNLFSYTLRFGLTFLSIAAAIVCTWTLWKRGQRENEGLVSAAQDIDAVYPSLEQRVSTLASCNDDRLDSQRLAHPAMLNRLSEETATLHQRVESKPIVSYRMLKLPLACLALAATVLLGMFAWDTPKTLVQIGRFVAPWSDLSTTKVTAVEADQVVARHEMFKLTASLSGRPVEEVEFISYPVDGSDSTKAKLWPSAKDSSVASLRQSKAIESFDYRFRAGDGQTDWHRVTVADRPKIDDLTMRIVPPEYTGKSAQTFQRLPKKLRVVAGTRLEIAVKPKANVRTARLVMGKTDWLSMALSPGGTYDCSLDLRQPVKFEVQLTELHGLVNRRPPSCFLQVVADQAPKVKIIKPTKAAVLLPDEAIDIHFQASDDFGVQEMALRVSTQREGEQEPTVHDVAIPIPPDSNRRKIKGVVQLDLAQFDLKDGDMIRYEIRVSDNFRPLEEEAEPIGLQPMKDVAMVPADTRPQGINDTAKNTSARPQNPGFNQGGAANPPTAKLTSEEDQKVDSLAGSPKEAGANPAAVKPQQPKDVPASNVAPSGAVAALDSTTKRETNRGTNSDQSPADQVPADAATNMAANENKIQSASEERVDAARAAAPAAIANSSSSMKSGNSANAGRSSSPSVANSPSTASSQSSQSQQSNAPSPSNPKTTAKPAEQPDLAKANNDPTQSTADPVNMTLPSLDVGGQSASSAQQQIKVDKYAGGFTADHRNQLELAISPTLELLRKSLISAGQSVKPAMSDRSAEPAAEAGLSSAAGELKTASEAVSMLNEKTKNTPYAFVGLRLESIRAADVAPAWAETRKAIDTREETRLQHARAAWNHISRALATLAKLDEQYQAVKRNLKRADDILKFKKMHRIFIEKSLAMLDPKNFTLNRPSRKGAEFDLDEEYLKRLKDVLQMRQDMMAELARILADDPQLLRRYMNRMNQRTWSIRDQLTLIANDQKGLAQRISSWSNVAQQPRELAVHNMNAVELHLSEIEGLVSQLADVRNEFISWLPLKEDADKEEFANVVNTFKTTGSALTEILADVETILLETRLQPDASRQIEPLLAKGIKVEQLFANTVKALRTLNRDSTKPEVVNNAARRVPDLESVQRDLQRWVGKLELLNEGLVQEVYSVSQENRRDQLLKYSVKLASLESQLVAALRNRDGTLPAGVAEQTKQLQKLLDADIPAAQLIAAQTLLDADGVLASRQQESILQKFEQAEQTFDAILQAIADELDKIPPDDPIASLLRDPTLDEILAQLENEQDFLEELGLGARPSNLQIMGGFLSSRGGGLGGLQQRMRRLTNRAFRNAMDRARVKDPSKKTRRAKENLRWNLLVGELGEDMLQGDNKIPPERYRAAIEHYSEQISKLKSVPESN